MKMLNEGSSEDKQRKCEGEEFVKETDMGKLRGRKREIRIVKACRNTT